MWLTNLKIAIIEKDTDKLNKLLDETPQLKDETEIQEAMYMLREAFGLVHTLRDDTEKSMVQIKKNIDFLNATEHNISNKLDIKS